MGAVGGVALALQVPGHGIGLGLKIPVLVAPGEDSPLGLGGAPGEDVGDEGAGIALGLRCV